MRTLCLIVLSASVLCLLPASAATAGDRAPASLEELSKALDELALRVETLRVEASKDPDLREIEIYKSYTLEQLKLKKRAVHAEKLVEFMVDPDKVFTTRQAAQAAIRDGARFRGDPDLSLSEKQGRRSKRAAFCDKHLIEHLEHKDAKARKLTNQLLNQLWKVNTLAAILQYDVSDKKTWKPARREWKKFLSKN